MARITKAFIDLDDTLNTFTMSALREVGCHVGHFDYEKFNPAWGMDIIRAANELHPSRTFSKKEFWDSLSEEFWSSVPSSEECQRIIYSCARLVGEENVCILTAFLPDIEKPYVAAAKTRWIKNYIPGWLEGFLIGPDKTPCACPNALLIDDSDKNVHAFRKAGGHAILVPRPWNGLHGRPVMKHIQNQMEGTVTW